MMKQYPPTRWLVCLALSAVGGLLGAVGCEGSNLSENSQSTRPPLRLVASGDTAGWLVPCGCASNQSGGLLRRGEYVRKERESGVQVVLVDVGGAAQGDAPYQRAKFEAILAGELKMNIAAHNLGRAEAELGASYLREVAERLKAPLLSANLRDRQGEFVAKPSIVAGESGTRLLIIGVLSASYQIADSQIAEPRQAILDQLSAQQGMFDWSIVLAYCPEAELRSLAAQLPEVDVILGGPTGQAIPPQRIGPVQLAAATNKGRFLISLDVPSQKGDPWRGGVAEMSDQIADDPAQTTNLATFREHLAAKDFTAVESGLVDTKLASFQYGNYQVAGSAACLTCHTEEAHVWQSSSHAHAWQTLVRQNAHVDSYCQQCHTTGFGLPGGFVSVRSSMDRVDVGCESCHGPSAAHVKDPRQRTPLVAKEQCVTCHDGENSPQFNYESYWPKIAHGERMP